MHITSHYRTVMILDCLFLCLIQRNDFNDDTWGFGHLGDHNQREKDGEEDLVDIRHQMEEDSKEHYHRLDVVVEVDHKQVVGIVDELVQEQVQVSKVDYCYLCPCAYTR